MEKNYLASVSLMGWRKSVTKICLLLTALFAVSRSEAQVLTYTVNYTSSSPTTTQVSDWSTYIGTLTNAFPYYKLKVYGSASTVIAECNNPTMVQDIAMRLNTYGTSGSVYTWTDGTNTWMVGNCSGNGPELAYNYTSPCACPSPGYIVRTACANCVGNAGGWGTATCGTPTQTVTVEFWYGTPCPVPTNKTASNFTSSSATLGWTAPTTTIGYDWYVDQSGAYPPITQTGTATTATSVNVSSLLPSTKYYLHLRNKCDATSKSVWDTLSFTTLPPCKPPVNFKPKNLTPTTGTVTWGKWPSALTYDYIVDQSRTAPTSITGVKNQVDTFDNLNSLNENTWYYIHIRSKCAANEISDWGLDSFLTPIPCRAPDVKISNVNTNAAVAYWDEVPTATKYEYVISTNPAPPVLGTEYKFTSLNLSALNDGKDYYVHVRSHCISLGINGISPWGTAAFKTFPVGISTVSKNDFSITTYPNPVKDVVTVKLNGISANANITVTDVNGRVVRTAGATAGTDVEINMTGLTPGFYMLKYMDDKNFGQIKITKE